jgi:hypothetical protein
MTAPSRATTPPVAHAASTQSPLGSRWATMLGLRKIPVPMIPPTTDIVAEKSPSSRR